ncbi:hypothetical protein Dsin_012673 [Dipteronia sinensis]|uniref:Uncharacterized protein n=1 Tax=Dipteronia sinensis TaxID=43782 RepID=A0AAE0AIZ3_9ROSI|nr:hypothetical protein Dsin_012673 [Dipteronia sinensis]
MNARKLVLVLLCITVIAPIVLFTDRFSTTFNVSPSKHEFVEDLTAFTVGGDSSHLNLLPQESSTSLKEPIRVVYSQASRKHKSARVLSATNEAVDQSQTANPIRQVTDLNLSQTVTNNNDEVKASDHQNFDNDSRVMVIKFHFNNTKN